MKLLTIFFLVLALILIAKYSFLFHEHNYDAISIFYGSAEFEHSTMQLFVNQTIDINQKTEQ